MKSLVLVEDLYEYQSLVLVSANRGVDNKDARVFCCNTASQVKHMLCMKKMEENNVQFIST